MPKSTRETLWQHIDRMIYHLERIGYHCYEMDSYYSGLRHKIEIGEAKEGDYIENKETDPYYKVRKHIFEIAQLADEYQTVIEELKQY